MDGRVRRLILSAPASSALGIAGMVVAMAGVMLISHWMGGDGGSRTPRCSDVDGGRRTPRRRRLPPVVVLALATSAGWGLCPVLIELAAKSVGGPSATMMLESQSLGLLMLGRPRAAGAGRRCSRARARAAQRRRVLLLLLAAAVLEVAFSVLFYLLIQAIGPC